MCERERERGRDRQTDRQTERQTETERQRDRQRQRERQTDRDRKMDGWMVYCIINGLTITILWVNDDEHDYVHNTYRRITHLAKPKS